MSRTKLIIIALCLLGSIGAVIGATAASMTVSDVHDCGPILFLLSLILFIIGAVLVFKK